MTRSAALPAPEWPVPVVWATLVAATLAGFVTVESHAGARIAGTLAVVLAALKIHLVFDQYMDLRWHHRPLRPLLAGWLAVVSTTLLAAVWAA